MLLVVANGDGSRLPFGRTFCLRRPRTLVAGDGRACVGILFPSVEATVEGTVFLCLQRPKAFVLVACLVTAGISCSSVDARLELIEFSFRRPRTPGIVLGAFGFFFLLDNKEVVSRRKSPRFLVGSCWIELVSNSTLSLPELLVSLSLLIEEDKMTRRFAAFLLRTDFGSSQSFVLCRTRRGIKQSSLLSSLVSLLDPFDVDSELLVLVYISVQTTVTPLPST